MVMGISLVKEDGLFQYLFAFFFFFAKFIPGLYTFLFLQFLLGFFFFFLKETMTELRGDKWGLGRDSVA